MNENVELVFKIIENEIVNYLELRGKTSSPELSKATNLDGSCDPVSGQPGWAFGFFVTRFCWSKAA